MLKPPLAADPFGMDAPVFRSTSISGAKTVQGEIKLLVPGEPPVAGYRLAGSSFSGDPAGLPAPS